VGPRQAERHRPSPFEARAARVRLRVTELANRNAAV